MSGGWNRRGFLARCAAGAAGFCAIDLAPRLDQLPRSAFAEDRFQFAPIEGGTTGLSDLRAAHWESTEEHRVVCKLCPRECRIADKERGACGVRENEEGVLKTLVHSRICAAHVDPIEKKPYFHFLPGSKSFSIATAGCNLHCRFCQNWEISQFRPEQVESVEAPPERIVESALRTGSRSIAYTYSEPIVFWEYVRDVADAGRARGIKSVMVSSGYIQEKPLRELIPRLDAVKIDLKGFTENYYREVCGGELAPVLKTLQILRDSGVWYEIVVLIVPTLNDDDDSSRRLCDWVAEELGPEVPIHFTRFHPAYRLRNLPTTPVRTMERILARAREAGLAFAYLGNVPGHPSESTSCPSCGKVVIRRIGYTILDLDLVGDSCPSCARKIPGVWS